MKLRLRPYRDTDASTILSWCCDKYGFYQWTAGVLGQYPISEEDFSAVTSLMPFVAFDEDGLVGFFTLRNPGKSLDELRFGFVIVDPAKRGRGCGKELLRLGIRYAFDIYGAEKVSLGVFENNTPAYHCYKAAGFVDAAAGEPESYHVMGQDWKCRELMIEREIGI